MARIVWSPNGHQVDIDNLDSQGLFSLYYDIKIAQGVSSGATTGMVDALNSRVQRYADASRDIHSSAADIRGYGDDASWFSHLAQGFSIGEMVKGVGDTAAAVGSNIPAAKPIAEAWKVSTQTDRRCAVRK
jgi:hypothetical protein